MSAPDPDGLAAAVRRDRARHERGQSAREKSVGRHLAMIGVLGWTIVLPALAGILAGRWLDRVFARGIFWTLGLLTGGLALGCWLAWKRIHQEAE